MQEIRLKELKNAYCDALGLAFGEFLDVYETENEDIINLLSEEELKILIEYAICKNKIAGVGELGLKVPKTGLVGDLFDYYKMNGKEIVSARNIDNLSARDFVGDRLILEVENLLDYNEGYLSKIVDFCASTQTPILIKMGQTLQEVGKIVNKFNCSPAELLEEYGFLDRECYIYGLNFLDKEDQKLLKNYNPTLILSPRDDGESGRGAINLYNLCFNGLNFAFSSGKCYCIDMFLEGKLALYNTANLMHERGLVGEDEVLNALQGKTGELLFLKDDNYLTNNLINERIDVDLPFFKTRALGLKEKVEEIAIKVKKNMTSQ